MPVALSEASSDGSYLLDIPETDELVTLAEQTADKLQFWVQVTDLSRAPQVGQPPDAWQMVEQAEAILERRPTAEGIEPTFTIPPHVRDALGRLVVTATERARAATVFTDPDMLAGWDNVDDPDLVPPLGVALDVVPVTLADAFTGDITTLIGEAPAESGIQSECGSPKRTFILPRDSKETAPRGTQYRAVLRLYKCHDEDVLYDGWAWGWDGKARPVDTATEHVYLWRHKYRTQLTGTDYQWDNVDPRQDRDASQAQQITWNVGFSAGITGGISGEYTPMKAKKIHPWSDYDGVLYHVSWISNKPYGSRDGDFWNGGGLTFLVPNGQALEQVQGFAKHNIQLWRCWKEKADMDDGPVCDPRK